MKANCFKQMAAALASTVAGLRLNASAATALVWVSSSDFKIGIAPKIVMTTSKSSDFSISLAGTGTVTINWMDDSEPETVALTSTETAYPHNYSGTTTHNIAIYGQNITSLYCNDIQLTGLDVNKNIKLIHLKCADSQSTSLGLSKNTALITLYCVNNQFTAAGPDALFRTLHSSPGTKNILYRKQPRYMRPKHCYRQWIDSEYHRVKTWQAPLLGDATR